MPLLYCLYFWSFKIILEIRYRKPSSAAWLPWGLGCPCHFCREATSAALQPPDPWFPAALPWCLTHLLFTLLQSILCLLFVISRVVFLFLFCILSGWHHGGWTFDSLLSTFPVMRQSHGRWLC